MDNKLLVDGLQKGLGVSCCLLVIQVIIYSFNFPYAVYADTNTLLFFIVIISISAFCYYKGKSEGIQRALYLGIVMGVVINILFGIGTPFIQIYTPFYANSLRIYILQQHLTSVSPQVSFSITTFISSVIFGSAFDALFGFGFGWAGEYNRKRLP